MGTSTAVLTSASTTDGADVGAVTAAVVVLGSEPFAAGFAALSTAGLGTEALSKGSLPGALAAPALPLLACCCSSSFVLRCTCDHLAMSCALLRIMPAGGIAPTIGAVPAANAALVGLLSAAVAPAAVLSFLLPATAADLSPNDTGAFFFAGNFNDRLTPPLAGFTTEDATAV